MAPEYLEAMKRDFLEVVSRYLVVVEDSIDMDMERHDNSLVLVSNIQVRELVRVPVAQ